MLHILITFDYELYFKKNLVSSEEILFNPTQKICQILDSKKVKGVFFADVCSVWQHNKYSLNNYSKMFEEQIRFLSLQGHDIELHIHPHWLKSEYCNKEWNFAEEYYTLDSFINKNEFSLDYNNIISKGIDYLENTIKPVNKNYKVLAYRGGGYSLQPYSLLIKSLVNNNIIFDSSVAMYQKSLDYSIQKYDYTNLPQKLNYYLSPNVELHKSDSNKNIENNNIEAAEEIIEIDYKVNK